MATNDNVENVEKDAGAIEVEHVGSPKTDSIALTEDEKKLVKRST